MDWCSIPSARLQSHTAVRNWVEHTENLPPWGNYELCLEPSRSRELLPHELNLIQEKGSRVFIGIISPQCPTIEKPQCLTWHPLKNIRNVKRQERKAQNERKRQAAESNPATTQILRD